MTIPVLTAADLEVLTIAFPTLDFTSPERRAVLLEGGSRDVQAAPGSGKTTLLAAKLLLMSGKWTHPGRGICVLSHTNVAREEISKRLSATATGARLLGYPHFVGTIHAFVNQFLALPLLRSDGEVVDVVDNDIFAARAMSLLQYKWKLKAWVKNNPHNGPKAIASLRYEGAELVLGWEEGDLPGVGSPSRAEAQALKDQLRAKGVFRFDDMFAFAERLMVRFPDITKRLSYRFPLVLIDEMQDTSREQEDLLSRIFDDTVVIQRYGDRNQRILGPGGDSTKLTFPRIGHLNVTSTMRFPESIAGVVRSVQVHGEAVTAPASPGAHPPVLMLYDTKAVAEVIDAFGNHMLSAFSDDELRRGPVKAICARKQGESKSLPGRHLCDYWPAFLASAATSTGHESIHRLLADPREFGVKAVNLELRVRDVKRAILLALRAAKSVAVNDIRDPVYLLRRLEMAGFDAAPVRSLCQYLATERGHTAAANWPACVDSMFAALEHLMPPATDHAAFRALDVFEAPVGAEALQIGPTNQHVVLHEQRSLTIHLGTVASVKGETHFATLVLEAHGYPAKCHDLEGALHSIATGAALSHKATESTRSFYRNLYVAASRPTNLLCLAMNRERAPDVHVQALRDRGWTVVLLGEPSAKPAAAVPSY
ncbi:MAG: UvrD-helicase domain-containing protein [Burkholderiales bacterium]|nr:UvrD-helicase domain-containing protein [Burkholderiales bacterium]